VDVEVAADLRPAEAGAEQELGRAEGAAGGDGTRALLKEIAPGDATGGIPHESGLTPGIIRWNVNRLD
jgi:hypothetical protein